MAKIVFVVGAGASTEFGGSMPIGLGLATAIEAIMTQETANQSFTGPISQALMRQKTGLSPVEIRAMQRVQEGVVSKESIDDFINEWRDVPMLQEVAKMGIAHALLEAEKETYWGYVATGRMTLSGALRQGRDSWLGRILRLHNRSSARRNFVETMSDVAFVVFNYDRLIETYLFYYLKTALAVPESEARDIVLGLPIILPIAPGPNRAETTPSSTFAKSSLPITLSLGLLLVCAKRRFVWSTGF